MVKEIIQKTDEPKLIVMSVNELLGLAVITIPNNEILTRIADINDRMKELQFKYSRLKLKKELLMIRAEAENIEEDAKAYLVRIETPEVKRTELGRDGVSE